MNVTLKQAATIICNCGNTNTVIMRGQPGIGKSAIMHTLAEQLPDYLPCYIDVANLDLGDIGMPVINRETMVTNYAPNARFGIGNHQTRPVLLMLDELGKASRPVLNMLLPVILEHRLGDVSLPTGSIVFATTNLDTDGVGDNIPAHAYNRMTELIIANPSVDEWLEWAGDNDIAPEVMVFAKQTPEVFQCYTDMEKGDKNPYNFNPMQGNTRTFCSPRSLAKASHLIKTREYLGSALLPALCGTIGEPAARMMEALINLSDELPQFDTIVAKPDTIKIPESVGALFILAFMLSGRVTSENIAQVMVYIKRLEEVSFEAHAVFIHAIASNKNKVAMACRNRAFTEACARLGKYF
jgi:hypothetical protein